VKLIVGEWHGRDAFRELVARKYPDWKFTVWRDGQFGIYWLANPGR